MPATQKTRSRRGDHQVEGGVEGVKKFMVGSSWDGRSSISVGVQQAVSVTSNSRKVSRVFISLYCNPEAHPNGDRSQKPAPGGGRMPGHSQFLSRQLWGGGEVDPLAGVLVGFKTRVDAQATEGTVGDVGNVTMHIIAVIGIRGQAAIWRKCTVRSGKVSSRSCFKLLLNQSTAK